MKQIQPSGIRDGRPIYQIDLQKQYVEVFVAPYGPAYEASLINTGGRVMSIFMPSPIPLHALKTEYKGITGFHLFEIGAEEYDLLAQARVSILAASYGLHDLVQYPPKVEALFREMGATLLQN